MPEETRNRHTSIRKADCSINNDNWTCLYLYPNKECRYLFVASVVVLIRQGLVSPGVVYVRQGGVSGRVVSVGPVTAGLRGSGERWRQGEWERLVREVEGREGRTSVRWGPGHHQASQVGEVGVRVGQGGGQLVVRGVTEIEGRAGCEGSQETLHHLKH